MSKCVLCKNEMREMTEAKVTCDGCRQSKQEDCIWAWKFRGDKWEMSPYDLSSEHENDRNLLRKVRVPCKRSDRALYCEIEALLEGDGELRSSLDQFFFATFPTLLLEYKEGLKFV